MHAGSSSVGPPPPLTGGAAGAIGPAPGPVRELPALALNAPNGCSRSILVRAPSELTVYIRDHTLQHEDECQDLANSVRAEVHIGGLRRSVQVI
ncbi:hypothetical protein FRC12_001053 [Ceratobasidium sp. 428]|nr:hypothetical protein FRC12_001053 [Ceratobasidium sp. 428]